MVTLVRWLCLLLMVLAGFALLGCVDLGGDSSDSSDSMVAQATIKRFGDYSTMVRIDVLVQPEKDVIIPGEAYSVVLMACDGFLFAHKEIGWVTSDFSPPKIGERDVGEIAKAEKKRLRSVILLAPAMDKAIFPMRQELAKLRAEREADENKYWERVWNGEASSGDYDSSKYDITESDYQRIARKYIKVVVMTYEEWIELKQESGQ